MKDPRKHKNIFCKFKNVEDRAGPNGGGVLQEDQRGQRGPPHQASVGPGSQTGNPSRMLQLALRHPVLRVRAFKF